MKKSTLILAAFLGLSACASSEPRIIQTSSDTTEVQLKQGMATQIEIPDGKIKSVTVGNPDLVSTGQTDNVVNLMAKQPGVTNLIIRAAEDGDIKVYQYFITVQLP